MASVKIRPFSQIRLRQNFGLIFGFSRIFGKVLICKNNIQSKEAPEQRASIHISEVQLKTD